MHHDESRSQHRGVRRFLLRHEIAALDSTRKARDPGLAMGRAPAHLRFLVGNDEAGPHSALLLRKRRSSRLLLRRARRDLPPHLELVLHLRNLPAPRRHALRNRDGLCNRHGDGPCRGALACALAESGRRRRPLHRSSSSSSSSTSTKACAKSTQPCSQALGCWEPTARSSFEPCTCLRR